MLSVRTLPKRGPVSGGVGWIGGKSDLDAPHVVLLIHGFNNSAGQAYDAYGNMVDHLRQGLPKGSASRLGAIWEFYWPGDQVVSPLPGSMIKGYRKSLGEVGKVAELLAAFLSDRPRRQHVFIVGHSMGGRITLEVLKRAAAGAPPGAYRGARIDGVCLMAAAVPVGLCRFGNPAVPYPTALPGCAERVLYSRSDQVLRFSFPFGQPHTADERGPAVGLTGGPLLRWRSRQPTGLGHGDYWRSARVANEITVQLGLRPIRTLPIEHVPATTLETLGLSAKKLGVRLLPRRFF